LEVHHVVWVLVESPHDSLAANLIVIVVILEALSIPLFVADTVVKLFGGVKLGAGGLVRAYTDAVAQALLKAEKVPLIRVRPLRCAVPYALEGHLRRALDKHGAQLLDVQHGSVVEARFTVAETTAVTLMAALDNMGQGRLAWMDPN
jgi:putative IMPACT (imprinted ancient) family translation regulator